MGRECSPGLKGQAAYEYLSLLSIALLIIIPLVLFSFNSSATQSTSTTGEAAMSRIASSAESVYSQGTGAKQTFRVYIPPRADLEDSSISGRLVILRVFGGRGEKLDIVRITDFNTTGSFPDNTGYQTMETETLQNGTVHIRPAN